MELEDPRLVIIQGMRVTSDCTAYALTHSAPMSLYADIVTGLLACRPQHMHVVS